MCINLSIKIYLNINIKNLFEYLHKNVSKSWRPS